MSSIGIPRSYLCCELGWHTVFRKFLSLAIFVDRLPAGVHIALALCTELLFSQVWQAKSQSRINAGVCSRYGDNTCQDSELWVVILSLNSDDFIFILVVYDITRRALIVLWGILSKGGRGDAIFFFMNYSLQNNPWQREGYFKGLSLLVLLTCEEEYRLEVHFA